MTRDVTEFVEKDRAVTGQRIAGMPWMPIWNVMSPCPARSFQPVAGPHDDGHHAPGARVGRRDRAGAEAGWTPHTNPG
jgi:hypothetical protein